MSDNMSDSSLELLRFRNTCPAFGFDASRHQVSLAFIDGQGQPWQAKIDGQQFLLAHRGNWQGRIERAGAVRYRDWRGNAQLRTVAQLRRE